MKALYSEKSSCTKRVVSVVLRAVGCVLLAFLLFLQALWLTINLSENRPRLLFSGIRFCDCNGFYVWKHRSGGRSRRKRYGRL